MRGLKISERLGSGLSCNGNTVAYLAGSSAPLNAFGLNSKQFSKIPFQERPGPAISSSYTSSLGFTIQVGALTLVKDLFFISSLVNLASQSSQLVGTFFQDNQPSCPGLFLYASLF